MKPSLAANWVFDWPKAITSITPDRAIGLWTACSKAREFAKLHKPGANLLPERRQLITHRRISGTRFGHGWWRCLGKHAGEASRLERILKVFDDWLITVGGPGDRDNVEPRGTLQEIVPLHVGKCQAR